MLDGLSILNAPLRMSTVRVTVAGVIWEPIPERSSPLIWTPPLLFESKMSRSMSTSSSFRNLVCRPWCWNETHHPPLLTRSRVQSRAFRPSRWSLVWWHDMEMHNYLALRMTAWMIRRLSRQLMNRNGRLLFADAFGDYLHFMFDSIVDDSAIHCALSAFQLMA